MLARFLASIRNRTGCCHVLMARSPSTGRVFLCLRGPVFFFLSWDYRKPQRQTEAQGQGKPSEAPRKIPSPKKDEPHRDLAGQKVPQWNTGKWRNGPKPAVRFLVVEFCPVPSCFFQQGSLKDTCCPFETCGFFNTKIKGNHHLQGNVRVYDVRQKANRRPKMGGSKPNNKTSHPTEIQVLG